MSELQRNILSRMRELGAIRMDLSFGCMVAYELETYTLLKKEDDQIRAGKKIFTFGNNNNGNQMHAVEEEVENSMYIIGHPPVLSDELVALKETCFHSVIGAGGHMHILKNDDANAVFLVRDLSKPYTLSQSTEYLEAFYNLIK